MLKISLSCRTRHALHAYTFIAVKNKIEHHLITQTDSNCTIAFLICASKKKWTDSVHFAGSSVNCVVSIRILVMFEFQAVFVVEFD